MPNEEKQSKDTEHNFIKVAEEKKRRNRFELEQLLLQSIYYVLFKVRKNNGYKRGILNEL